jgi:hypothetical protein
MIFASNVISEEFAYLILAVAGLVMLGLGCLSSYVLSLVCKNRWVWLGTPFYMYLWYLFARGYL